MELNQIFNTIISEPIYLSIVVLFSLAILYSILKKFFKLLIISLVCLLIYLAFLIYTNQDLPGDYDDVIYNQIDAAKEKASDMIDEIKK